MKMRSFATLLFFLISLAIFLNDGLASENSDISTSKQSESGVVQPEWLLWGRPRPWGRPAPKWPIPGHGVALPPLPAHKFPPLPWWAHPPPTKGSGSGVSDTEQVDLAEQDDSYYQQEWFFHPYIPGFRRPFPRPFFPRRPFPVREVTSPLLNNPKVASSNLSGCSGDAHAHGAAQLLSGPSLAMVWHCRHYQPTSFHLSLGGPIRHQQQAAAMAFPFPILNKSRLLNKPTTSNKTIVTTSKNGFFIHTYQGFVVHSHALSFLVDPFQVGGPCRHDRPTIEMD
ncbi:hypothetical protein RHSIM_Rhsim12G0030400 [Rhododendron simsii]|uniref:Uncharacterized protein n=1 Tax=Rhododendron simsii TaxID=118357 RepID=A0A834G770_RHOSS|nr:hypothetical protein RHSIM_Rhsim12G0030400 [Rhododendron simsii]